MIDRRALGIAGVVYFAAGLWITSHFATWTDEEYTLATTGAGAAYAFSRALNYELQAPLYFVVLALWRELNGTVWFARLFSILCATALFFALAHIGRRVDSKVNPLPFALLVAVNPFVLNAAFEIRLYAFALLFSALMWLTFDSGFIRAENRRARAAFVVLTIAATYVQYFMVFMVAGFGVALLVRRRSALRPFLGCAAIVAVAVAPLVFAAKSQVGGYATNNPPPLALVRITAAHPWLDFVVPSYPTWSDVLWIREVYYLLIAVCGIVVILGRPKLDRATVAALACAATIEFVFLGLVLFLGTELNVRYFVALFVPVAVAAYSLFLAILRGARPKAAFAFAPALLAVLVSVEQYRHLAQDGDWKRVCAFLERSASAGDVIAIFPADATPAFLRQYRGNVPYVPFPRPYSHERYSVEALSLASQAEVRVSLRKLSTFRRIWLIEAGRCSQERPLFGCDKIEPAAEGDRDLQRVQFYNSAVYEFSGALVGGPAKADANRVRQVAQARNQQIGGTQVRQP